MTKEELKQEAEEKLLQAELDYCHELSNPCEPSELPYSELLRFETGYKRGYLASAEPREKRIAQLENTNKKISDECHKLVDSLDTLQKKNAELKGLVEKYRQAVDKCLHITFMGGGCEVNTIGQYATLVDGYLTDVEGLAKWKN